MRFCCKNHLSDHEVQLSSKYGTLTPSGSPVSALSLLSAPYMYSLKSRPREFQFGHHK